MLPRASAGPCDQSYHDRYFRSRNVPVHDNSAMHSQLVATPADLNPPNEVQVSACQKCPTEINFESAEMAAH
jgi:hypothetical protein